MSTKCQIESWIELQGLKLSNRQAMVLKSLIIKAQTNFELCDSLKLPINCISGRVSELKRKGLIEIIGEKINSFSGLPNSVYGIKQLSLF